jgi:hypothetical protein
MQIQGTIEDSYKNYQPKAPPTPTLLNTDQYQATTSTSVDSIEEAPLEILDDSDSNTSQNSLLVTAWSDYLPTKNTFSTPSITLPEKRTLSEIQKDSDGYERERKRPNPEQDIKLKTKTIKTKALEYCIKNRITNFRHFKSFPLGDYSDIILHQQANSFLPTIFGVVKQWYDQLMVKDNWVDYGEVKKEDCKIYRLLKEVQGWKDEGIKIFVRSMVGVANRCFGKKNTVILKGKSSAGKTMLVDSFTNAYFKNLCASPDSNPRSQFTFGPLLGARICRIEEPNIGADNWEDYKKLLGGQEFETGVKYKSNCEVDKMPCFITTNRDILQNIPHCRGELVTRAIEFGLYQQIPLHRTDEFYPITKKDWDEMLTAYKKDISKVLEK